MIPHDVIMGDKIRGRIWMWAVTIQLIIILLLGAYWLKARALEAAEGEIADLSSRKNETEEKIKQLKILQDRRDMLDEKKRVINALLHRKSPSFLFTELEEVMDRNLWLTSLDYNDGLISARGEEGDEPAAIRRIDQTGAQMVSQNEAPAVSVVMRGMARSNKDLAGFLERLSQSRSFSDVNMKYSQRGMYEGLNVVEFEIETQSGYKKN